MGKTGQKYKQRGYSPNLPVLIIPGLCSSAMKVVESPHKEWIDRRIWLDITTIGFGKVWDQMSIVKRKKKKKKITDTIGSNESLHTVSSSEDLSDVEPVIQPNSAEDDQNKRRWIAHMVLQKDGVTDPPGIKLRPIETIHGIMYLDPGAITNALSYVFGPLVETLWDIGYTDANLRAAPYDWRIPPCFLEKRDGYFTKLKEKVDDMVTVNENKKVVIVAHSLGTRCTHYFLRFCEQKYGRQWISDHIHTWVAVGPLFLGAPKSVRATMSGERMGLDAFLFEDEGILLSRGCGSSAWMFPYVTSDYEFLNYVYVKDDNGIWRDKNLKTAFIESDVENIWDGYVNNYHNDPCFGVQEDQLKAPPVDKILAIYGINLKTENFYFYKPSNGLTKFELDSTGDFPNYSVSGGIAYETKETQQNKLRGKRRGGDGTVPYPSLSYCSYWEDEIDVVIEELEGAEHREILKDKTFTRLIVEYNCHAPAPPQLPDSFKNLSFDVTELRDRRKANRKLTLTQKGIQVQGKNGNTLFHKKYSAVQAVTELSASTFSIKFVRSSSVYVYYSLKSKAIVQELNVRIKFIEYSRPSAVEAIDDKGQTDLHRAVKDGDIVLVRELLSDDRNVNAQDKDDWTPLHIAAFENKIDIVFLLLKHPKIDTNLSTKDSTYPLTYALRNTSFEDSEYLWNSFVEAGADINCKGSGDSTLLHEACSRKNIRAANWLIKAFCNVNARNAKGETPLHYAIHHNDQELISLLLENGADRHLQNENGQTPLNYAQKISTDLLTFLRDYKVCGYRARAFHAYEAETAEEISFKDGDRINNIKITSDYGDGWWFGECNGKKGYFPSNYVKVSEQIRDESRPSLGSPEPEDGPLDTRDEYGQTALHKACFNDNMEEVFKLLQAPKININAQDRNGWTPAHCAASQGAIDVLLVLLNTAGINLTKRSTDGTTVLHYVARLKPENDVRKTQLTQILDRIRPLVDIDVLGRASETPLHHAVLKNSEFAVKYLLEHEANPNALNDGNTTPLFYAVGNQHIGIVKLLLSHGADPTIKSKRGTPLDVAMATNSSTILQLLEQYKPSAAKEKEQLAVPVLPARKHSYPVPPAFKLTKSTRMPMYSTFGDIAEASDSDHEDDFEKVEEGEFCTDPREEAIKTLISEHFGSAQDFERYVLKYLIDKVHNGNPNGLKSAIPGGNAGMRKSFIGATRPSTPPPASPLSSSPTSSKKEPENTTPATAGETANTLLTKKKKKGFFSKK